MTGITLKECQKEYKKCMLTDSMCFVQFQEPKQTYICFNNDTIIQHIAIIMAECYNYHAYDRYDVKGKVVVDIGGYYGDTAIYFLNAGAKAVYVYEPYASANFILPNILMNYYGDAKVEVQNLPVLGSPDKIKYAPMSMNYGASVLETGKGTEIEPMTLAKIADHVAETDIVLKMDCEGAEHDIINLVDREVIRKFQYILMEVHYHYEDVIDGLKSFGYEVSEPEVQFNDTWMIYAKRIDD